MSKKDTAAYLMAAFYDFVTWAWALTKRGAAALWTAIKGAAPGAWSATKKAGAGLKSRAAGFWASLPSLSLPKGFGLYVGALVAVGLVLVGAGAIYRHLSPSKAVVQQHESVDPAGALVRINEELEEKLANKQAEFLKCKEELASVWKRPPDRPLTLLSTPVAPETVKPVEDTPTIEAKLVAPKRYRRPKPTTLNPFEDRFWSQDPLSQGFWDRLL